MEVFCRTVDGILEGLLRQAINRVPSVSTTQPLLTHRPSLFTPPRDFGSCDCVTEAWTLLIKKITEVSTLHAVGELRFWSIFNKHFNTLTSNSDNISGLVWVFEEVVKIVSTSCPVLPVNWGALQELTKQSCVKVVHLKQLLRSLTTIAQIWQPNIVIIMTLQQDFVK